MVLANLEGTTSVGGEQYVSINGFNSSEAILKNAVPQGSVLGPLLFLIHINDLNQALKNCLTYHFAEDTNILPLGKSAKKSKKE